MSRVISGNRTSKFLWKINRTLFRATAIVDSSVGAHTHTATDPATWRMSQSVGGENRILRILEKLKHISCDKRVSSPWPSSTVDCLLRGYFQIKKAKVTQPNTRKDYEIRIIYLRLHRRFLIFKLRQLSWMRNATLLKSNKFFWKIDICLIRKVF